MISDNILAENAVEKANESEVFKSFFCASLLNSLPVAVWRMPNQETKTIISDLSGKTKEIKGEIENLSQGYLISPFINERSFNFLKADLLYKSKSQEIIKTPESNFLESRNENEKKFYESFNKILSDKSAIDIPSFPDKKIQATNKENYLNLVKKSIENINNKTFNKVVVSRAKEVELPDNFDYIEAFDFLCELYPSAFVSLSYTPEYGIWIGATPETLISVDENNTFKTVSLAGTQAKDKYETLAEAAWTQKEIEEQALVSRYIINCFKQIRLREFEEFGPRTVAAGSLLHLCTDFIVDMEEVNFHDLGSVMLSLLHPTSAVCGMPKPQAMDFINTNEGYDRELYSGFLGPVNIENRTNIFVNLRCMQILNNKAVLYAGGGITRDSIPEKEWNETEMKMGVMGKLFT